jgi:hypothetical protein
MNLTNDRHRFVQTSCVPNSTKLDGKCGKHGSRIAWKKGKEKQGESSREDEEIKYGRIWGEENEIDAFPRS